MNRKKTTSIITLTVAGLFVVWLIGTNGLVAQDEHNGHEHAEKTTDHDEHEDHGEDRNHNDHAQEEDNHADHDDHDREGGRRASRACSEAS